MNHTRLKKRKRRYITGFDGLRTIGVIGVILYHLMPYQFRGGYLGVPIFMVISGYLITDIMIQEWHRSGRVNVKSFFIRRIKRLYPGLLTMLLGTSAFIVLFQRNLLTNLHKIFLTNITYVYNWWEINNGQSYFERFSNNESPFVHLWTLSIEGQYYLIWPFIVVLLLLFVKKPNRIFRVIFLAAIVSALLMGFMYQPNVDPSRVYYGTDTRIFSILLGSALAFVWPTVKLRRNVEMPERLMLDGVGILSFVGMGILMLQMSDQSSFLYRGGMFLFSILTVLLVAVVAHPGSDWNQVLSNPLFSWIGKHSYGIYLFQFPVMIFYESKVKNIAAHPILNPIIEVAIILLITVFSYRYIEQPLAHVNWQQTKQFFSNIFQSKGDYRKHRVITGSLVLVALAGLVGVASAPFQKAQARSASSVALEKNIKENAKKNAERRKKLLAQSDEKKAKATSDAADEQAQASSQPAEAQPKDTGLSQSELKKAQSLKATAIGDSVMLDASESLQEIFPNMVVDAAVSRQLSASLPILNDYLQKGQLNDVLLVGLGTNGPFSDTQLDQVMQIAGKKREVFWINTHVPTRSWQNSVNDLLTASAKKYPNLHIIDWYSESQNHPDWFYSDDVHPNPDGMKHYSDFIAKEILSQK